MTHFAALVNVGVPPEGLTRKEETKWIKQRLEFIVEPYSEDLDITPYIKDSKKMIKEEIKRLIEEQKKPGTYMHDKYPDKDLENESIEDFVSFWYGGKVDKKENRLITYNPRSRWDWYEVGGRWEEMLIQIDKTKVNICYSQNIDFDAYHSDARTNATNFYAKYIEFLIKKNNGATQQELWGDGLDFFMCDVPNTEEKNGKLEIVEDFEDFFKRAYQNGCFSFKTYIDVYGWHSETSYGWFGISSGDEHVNEYLYAKEFEDKIRRLDNNTVLAVVDFHI